MSLRFFLLLLMLLPLSVAAQPARVFVTVAPLAWLVQEVGGEQVRVQSLVRPGQDPHGFEPSPRQLGELQQASAYLSLGLPFEQAWLPRVARQNPSLRIVTLVEGEAEHHQHGDHHHHDGDDPHVWTDPVQMIALSEKVRALLDELLPEHAGSFARRQATVAAELQRLDAELAARFSLMPARVFLVHHPAWGHLAERYGLTQLAVEQEGKEPGPRAMAALTAQVQRYGIRTLFVEPQASEHLIHGLADALELRVEPLNPLAADYPANMRRVAERIAESQR